MIIVYCRSVFDISPLHKSCAYGLHPSILFLFGESDKIELKDLRCSFPGMSVSDRHVPFQKIDALIPHNSDQNLVALSCQVDTFTVESNVNRKNTEIRLYDLRYPKESTMRISCCSPVTQFLSFGSFFCENYGTRLF